MSAMRRTLAIDHLQVVITIRTALRRRIAPRLVTVATVSALLVASGCGLFTSGPRVVLLGDSLTVLTFDQMSRVADGDFTLELNATSGKRIDENLDAAELLAATNPPQVIINLGSNDILQRRDVNLVMADLETMIDQFADVSCLHLVTINEQMQPGAADYATSAQQVNDEIRQLAKRRLSTDVIDWNQIVIDNGFESVIGSDGIHPNDRGVELLADAYVAAMRTC